MKKIVFIVSFFYLSYNTLAGVTLNVSGSTIAEVGINNSYTANLVYSSSTSDPTGTTGIKVLSYSFSTNGTNGSGMPGSIDGGINNTISSSYFTNTVATSLTVPIKWGDGHLTNSEFVKVTAVYNFIDASGNTLGTTTQSVQNWSSTSNGYQVFIKRVCQPTIFNISTIQNCCQTNITASVNNFCEANVFTWSATNGAIIASGQGTAAVTITPPLIGNFKVSCSVKRSTGHANYVRTATTPFITRVNPSIAINSSSAMCMGTSNSTSVNGNLCGLSNVTWSSTVGTFTSNTINSTINVSNTLVSGSSYPITATANYNGGCVATIIKNVTIWNATQNIPAGTFSWQSANLYSPTASLVFTPSNFVNGVVMKSQTLFSYHLYYTTLCPNITPSSVYAPVTISYTNPCGSASKTFNIKVWKPACNPDDDDQFPKRINNSVSSTNDEMMLYPNPASEYINVSLNDFSSGVYNLTGINGKFYMKGEFANSKDFLIFFPELNDGIYFLNINIGGNIVVKKIEVKK